MANKVDELIIQIKADTKQLQKELKQIEGKIKVTGAAGGAAFGSMAGSLSKVKGPALAAAAAIAAVVIPMKVIAGVGAGFEDLKDSLDQVFGSIEAGDKAMEKVFQFAQNTPFQIEDATKAFIQLKSAGIEPSMDMLQTFADTASTSIDQLGAFEALIRIVQRSAAGGMGLEEINQLDDRGIPATKILTEALGKSREELSQFGKTAEGAAEMVKILTDGLQVKFGGAMENKMDNLSTKTSNMVIAFKQLADEIFKSGLGDFLKGLADRLTALANSIGQVIRKVTGRQTLADITGQTDPALQEARLREMRNEQQDKQKVAEAKIKKGKGGQPIADRRNAIAAIIEIDFLLDELTTKSNKTSEQVKTSLSTLLEGDINFMSEFNSLLKNSIPELEQIDTQMQKVEAMRGKLGETGQLIATDEEIQRILDFLQQTKDELAETTSFTDTMQQTIISASNAFTTDFVNSLLAGENALDSFKDFAKNIVSQIIATFLQMAVVNKILNSVFGLTGTDALPTISLGKKAGGGTVQGGSPYMVGERGPEIFVPNTGGTIMNNMNSKNAMGGGTPINIYQNVNFATGVVSTVRAEVTKMMPQIADVTKAAVQESAMRGGNFRRSLVGG